MKSTDSKKIICAVLFALYAAVMLFLLFVRNGGEYGSFDEAVSDRLLLVPFQSIAMFIRLLSNGVYSEYFRFAFVNLFGNIIMFMPLGIFLPVLFKKQRNFLIFLLTVILTITAVEVLQLVTLRGFCDIDDLILNTLGASLGFVIYVIFSGIFRRKNGDKKK